MKKINLIILLLAAVTGIALAQQLEVSPNPAEVIPGGAIRFSVPGQEQAAILWQVLPPSLGTMDDKGLFTAGSSAGQGIVRAAIRDGDKRLLGHALIKIVGGKAEGLTVKVSPGSARLEPGTAEQFSAEISHLDGEPATAAVISWQVVPAGLGTIDQNGNFTSLNQGTGRIVALARSDKFKGMGQAKITVGAKPKPQKLMVEMTPAKVNLKPGENVVFSVSVNDRDGNPVAAAVEFQVEPSGLGTIDGSGNFTAGKKPGVGMIKVSAKNETGTGTAKSLVIVEEKIQRYTVKVKPRQSALEPGRSLEFTAAAFDNSGNPVTPPYWVWKVIPEKLGEISPQGLFTAGQKAGQGKVVAALPPQFGQGQAAASIRIKPGQPLRVKIDPPAARLLPGATQQFTATVTGPDGAPRADVRIAWKVYPPGVGTITPNGLFTAGTTPQLGAVIALVSPDQGGGKGIAGISVSRYYVHIDAVQRPLYLSSGEKYPFKAIVRDNGGNEPPGITLLWSRASLSPNFGNIDQSTGLFTAGWPLTAQVEGLIYVKALLNGQVIGGDGIKVYVSW
ncbi:hypothetical protein HY768_05885 [candidate division TA06 bacterium]|uniref:Intimin n=1 Tax=candidate division TA06 bacterium TaxID=2250710 RepID=A0A933MK84_UNCT6|nr:hypothetical protein [candidate division TA06 bacterium]